MTTTDYGDRRDTVIRLSQNERDRIIRTASNRILQGYEAENSVKWALKLQAEKAIDESGSILLSRKVYEELAQKAMSDAAIEARLRKVFGR
jgi:hypothetical protein